MAPQKKPIVLRIGAIRHAKEEWSALSDLATLLDLDTSIDRKKFLEECSGKFKDITAIYRLNSTDYTGPFDQELVSKLPKSLRYICHNGAGYDNVDPAALLDRKILFSNCPGAVDAPTANIAFFLMLGCFRNLYKAMGNARTGKWKDGLPISHDPEGKVLGILGMGGIGRALAKRARGFDMEIIYHNRNKLPADQEGGARYVTFDQLLAQSDCISLNLPLNDNTRHIISTPELSKCKKGVIIINTARGAVIDEAALVEALEAGQVGNVGLDVFEHEPKIHEGLLRSDKTFLLPHVGTSTYEGQYAMEKVVIDNLRSALAHGTLPSLVPELQSIKDIYKH
ncbi:putative Hydroxyisocaproate dehydrogenase [Taphrina deformans PYCC 5710]|uniref:Hydroxyisocaproate dehydrogenase n=1 Tax=Taphrina deformans (strain PYCC 5710 / ATCC 11124 / CBS 356.35 / IMI 108563 / JCM 9778 / NBRC 8474) TaxID=1097556 RepID=R4X9T3_TAPDE|nr:putative Hydroxyisocaproate dehydrogenase [Taphrina deformans PYCC 5710]|eukprot:CCG82495.1 putative Hydroxyisocaproate dehydrogenase [Taphrina deformans PYCC 5710]